VPVHLRDRSKKSSRPSSWPIGAAASGTPPEPAKEMIEAGHSLEVPGLVRLHRSGSSSRAPYLVRTALPHFSDALGSPRINRGARPRGNGAGVSGCAFSDHGFRLQHARSVCRPSPSDAPEHRRGRSHRTTGRTDGIIGQRPPYSRRRLAEPVDRHALDDGRCCRNR
jgi:hypothetical protein